MSRPELRVILAPLGSDHALLFSRHDRHLALGSRPEPGRLAPLKASLTEDLGFVRRALGRDGEVISWEAARAAVAEIKKIGGWLLHDLLGADSARAEELENFLRYIVPEWREGASGEVEARVEPSPACPPELATFPFEFLPVFDRALPGPIRNLHELAQAVSGVLGYAAVLVRRRKEDAWTELLQLKREGASGRVPVMVFRDANSLRAVRGEIAYIAHGTNAFRVISQWPSGVLPPFEDALAQAMFAERPAGTAAPQVMHFCSHYTGGPLSSFGFADKVAEASARQPQGPKIGPRPAEWPPAGASARVPERVQVRGLRSGRRVVADRYPASGRQRRCDRR